MNSKQNERYAFPLTTFTRRADETTCKYSQSENSIRKRRITTDILFKIKGRYETFSTRPSTTNFQTKCYSRSLAKIPKERLPFSSCRTRSTVSSLKCNDFFERSRIGSKESFLASGDRQYAHEVDDTRQWHARIVTRKPTSFPLCSFHATKRDEERVWKRGIVLLRHCTAPIVYADRSNREYRSRFASFSSAFELRRSFGANFRQFSSQRNFFLNRTYTYTTERSGCINGLWRIFFSENFFFFSKLYIDVYILEALRYTNELCKFSSGKNFLFFTLLTHLDTFIRVPFVNFFSGREHFLLNRRCMGTLRQIHETLITIKEKISIDIIKFLFHDC